MLATRTGVKAVEMIHDNEFGKMAALVGSQITEVPLEEATRTLKLVDKEWLDLLKIFLK
jgi:6-phosphofructokinase 1